LATIPCLTAWWPLPGGGGSSTFFCIAAIAFGALSRASSSLISTCLSSFPHLSTSPDPVPGGSRLTLGMTTTSPSGTSPPMRTFHSSVLMALVGNWKACYSLSGRLDVRRGRTLLQLPPPAVGAGGCPPKTSSHCLSPCLLL
jgi:hypothetical protein